MKKRVISIFIIFLLTLSCISFSKALSEYNLTYDDNGNLVQDDGQYYEYDSFNQLKRVRETNSTGNLTAEYFYDHEGNRIKKIEVLDNGENQTTYYMGGNFVQVVNSSGTFNSTYYYDETNLIAGKNSEGEVRYYHPDHLGSTTIITNETGNVVEELSYLPFGEMVEGGDSRYSYTGKEKDTETGLYYYGVRYYDPYFRQFIQPDTHIKEIYNPQDLNRYAYVRNNPYKYNDPSGESPTLISGAIGLGIGASIGVLVSIGSQLYSTGQVNWADAGKSAVIGGVAGGVAGLTLGLGNVAIGAAGLTGKAALAAEAGSAITSSVISGQVARGASNLIEGNSPLTGLGNPRDIGIDTAIGLGTFGLSKAYQSAYISNRWSKATGKSPTQNMGWHYDNYAVGKNIKMSKLQYTIKSQDLYSNYIGSNLPKNTKVNTNVNLKFGGAGIKITTPKGEMGIYTQGGKTVSYHPAKESITSASSGGL